MFSYSCVHWLRTKRNVIDDFPHPPSPHTVMVILLFSIFPTRQTSSLSNNAAECAVSETELMRRAAECGIPTARNECCPVRMIKPEEEE